MAILSNAIQGFLDDLNANAPSGPPVFTAEALRKGPDPVAPHQAPVQNSVKTHDFKVTAPEGHDIPVREYIPSGTDSDSIPTLLYIHGGCWIFCNIQSHDRICQYLSHAAQCRVISLDYRLAPEHPFPAGLEDVYTVAQSISTRQLFVAGDSAGGNLATALCMLAQQRQGPSISGQVLFYPITDISRFDTSSYLEFADDHLLTRDLMAWGAAQYIQSEKDRRNPLVSPLLSEDLSYMPPALVITAEADVLRDEGEAYARRLQEAGVKTRLTRYDGMIHAFAAMAGSIEQGAQALDECADFIRSLSDGHSAS